MLKLQISELISLLSIYSQRETFHIGQHHTRANFYIGLVGGILALSFASYSQGEDTILLKLFLPVIAFALSEIAILSLERTFRRVNQSLVIRMKIEQQLLLQEPTPVVAGSDRYYFPGEPIRPLDQAEMDAIEKLVPKDGQTLSDAHVDRVRQVGQQRAVALLFRGAQAIALVLFAALVAKWFNILPSWMT